MKNENPLVSIIVPIYNVEDYLIECVESIVNQTYHNIEIILVDDGSLDNSGEICDDYCERDERVKVIHKKNGGLSDARNSGLEVAVGKYVYFCDSDDYLTSDCMERLVNLAEKTEADCIMFDSYVVRGNTLELDNTSYMRTRTYPAGSGADMIYAMTVNDEYIPCVQLCFYRKGFIIDCNLNFYKEIVGEDELFTYNIFMNNPMTIHINEPLYYHRLRPGSIMTTRDKDRIKRFYDYCTISDRMYEYAITHNKLSDKLFKTLIDRILKSAILIFREMDGTDKLVCGERYKLLKKFICNNRGFDDISLLIRLRWFNIGVLISGIRKNWRKLNYGLRNGK